MLKFKKNDKIIVICGKEKGKTGIISQVLKIKNEKNYKVIVDGLNFVKKHTKGNPGKGLMGNIIDKESPIDYSNIAHYNSNTKKICKISFNTFSADGKKRRSTKSDGVLL